MRIARFLSAGSVHHGVLVDDATARLIIGSIYDDFRVADSTVRIDKLLAPVVPTDILCIGLNYNDHAKETGGQVPDNPMLFMKASNALADPDAKVVVPAVSARVDYEAELVVVIKRDCRKITPEQATDHILGYTCGIDVSARDWQKDKPLNGGQFTRGKSFDGFAPLGPWIVTHTTGFNPDALRLVGRLNGQVVQNQSTSDMIFDVATIVSSLSRTMTVRAGSVIYTGTPSGVGDARNPPLYLKPGDVFETEIESIGTLRASFVADPD
jgi:2-keto-4-pentenoate hydratase/2-oxohepta-3-ene-1,7-dioic acid hydratase in catechol pathway